MIELKPNVNYQDVPCGDCGTPSGFQCAGMYRGQWVGTHEARRIKHWEVKHIAQTCGRSHPIPVVAVQT